MADLHESTAGLVKQVRVLRSEPARADPRTPTSVHFIEAGQRRIRQVGVGRVAYFEGIDTVAVRDTVPGALNLRPSGWSPRDLARRGYYAANATWADLRAPLKLEAPVFDARVREPNNMAHLLLDIIPCCLHARQVAGQDTRFLLRKLEAPFRALLEVFGIEPLVTRRHIEAEFVRIRGTRGLAAFELLDTFDCAAITSLPDVYAGHDFATSVGFERVFLARRGARALLNHADVQALVTRYGYETVYMEDYSVRDQLSIGARARHVVAIHGAAMGFLAMGRGIESVIELMPKHLYHEMFAVAMTPRAPHYHLIVSEYDPAVPHSGWAALAHYKNQPFAVDLALLEQSLAAVH